MKRIYSILLVLCVSSMLSAQLSIWDGTDDVWTKGAGTESSPYLIESAQQLAFIASMVNGGVTTYENTYFKLMTNINLNNRTWVPIGESSTKCFKGHFDGNNKIIWNATVYLFGYIKSAEIIRLSIKMRGLVEHAESSMISSCFAELSVNTSSGMFAETKSCSIENCNSSVVNVSCNSRMVGGIVGYAQNTNIISCRTYGSMSGGGNGGYTTGNNLHCGGIVGLMDDGSVKFCSNQCIINGGKGVNTSTQYSVGGIIGGGQGSTQIINCESLSSTTYRTESGNSSYDKTYYAGICGLPISNSSGIDIRNCFTIMNELYPSWHFRNLPDYRKGCISYVNSYSSADKTEQAMKSASFPIVLNTDSTVFIKDITPNVNNGYPIYANQVYSVTDALTTIGFTSAQLLGHFYALNADSVGFEYKKANDNTHWYQSVTGQASGNIITCDLTELTVGTNYVYRVWVERNGVRYFGEEMSFTTLQCSKTITPLTATICQGEEYTFNSQQLTQSGAYYDTLVATNGCDSIIKLTLTIMPTAKIDKYDTIMIGDSYDFYGEILTESGDYEHYIPMVNKCNLIILHLYVRQPDVILTANVNDPLMGHVEGAGTFEKFKERTIIAVPNEGYHFVQWNDGVTTNPRIIYLSQDTTFTAEFAINQYAISVTCNSQQGSVDGENGTFNHGTELTYIANAKEGYHFIQWSDEIVDNPRTIVLTQDSILSAEFAINIYLVQFFGFNEVLLDSQSIEHGSAAVAPEVPIIDHFDFVGWDKEFTNITTNLDVFAIYQKNTEDVENVNIDTLPQKVLIDGQILILRGDKTYTLTGQEVK